MRGDLLTGGTPKRLLQSNGKWSLEVVRQVAIDNSVYRPHSQLLDGPELIIRYLKRNPNFQRLADATLKLLRAQKTEGNCSFDAVNGDWIPSTTGGAHLEDIKRRQKTAARRSQYVQLLELRTEHIRLQHAHRALLKRVSDLATQVETNAVEIDALKKQGPIIVQQEAVVAAVTESTTAPDAAPEAAAGNDPAIALPPAHDLIRCLEQLIGGDTSAVETPGGFPISASTRDCFVSTLVDDEGEVVGAVLMDLKATVFLGGTLLMVPEGELSGQVKNRKPSEDSIAASSEVCNSMSGSINNAHDNIHVRSNFLEELDFAALSWLQTPSAAITLKDSFGGLLTVAAK